MIYGVGTDIIEIDRIEHAITKWGDGFLSHIFTEPEINYCRQYKKPAQHFAVRFAAKEAVFKAIGDNPHITWKDIEIVNDLNGKPVCRMTNGEYQDRKILISLSHSKYYAVAHAIITQE
ncbi:MAG: holo-ACP synthase [Candidatus Omnitrophica bacterium]|nr:holo-ACP synthase [Candidatus Omnitrophota bacterium]